MRLTTLSSSSLTSSQHPILTQNYNFDTLSFQHQSSRSKTPTHHPQQITPQNVSASSSSYVRNFQQEVVSTDPQFLFLLLKSKYPMIRSDRILIGILSESDQIICIPIGILVSEFHRFRRCGSCRSL